MTLLTSYIVSKQTRHENMGDALLSLSRGKCSNGRPVYDLWVFESGYLIYKGISNVEKNGIHKTAIPLDTVNRIKSYLSSLSSNDVGDSKGRDNPLTIIKYDNKKIVYQSSRAKGALLELNNLLEHFANSINKEL